MSRLSAEEIEKKTSMSKEAAAEVARRVAEITKGSAFDKRKEEQQKSIALRVDEMKKRLKSLSVSEQKHHEDIVSAAVYDMEKQRDLSRVMVHLDMDAFYASVEIRDRPDLAGEPIAVGGQAMLSTCNYEARKYGVRSAMPGFVAKQICPKLKIIPCNFTKYNAVAKEVREIIRDYCPDFVSGGLDEAYLDLTQYLEERITTGAKNAIFGFLITEELSKWVGCKCENQNGDEKYCGGCKLLRVKVGDHISFGDTPWSVVEEIRFKILLKTKLTSSAGIASNTMLAKIASDLRKPNSQYQVPCEISEISKLMTDLPVGKVPFIGPVSSVECLVP